MGARGERPWSHSYWVNIIPVIDVICLDHGGCGGVIKKVLLCLLIFIHQRLSSSGSSRNLMPGSLDFTLKSKGNECAVYDC